MGKRYLLDSNTVIDYIAGLYPDKAVQWLNQLIDEEINVSIITKIEVLSFDPDKNDNYTVLVDFFEASNILERSSEVIIIAKYCTLIQWKFAQSAARYFP